MAQSNALRFSGTGMNYGVVPAFVDHVTAGTTVSWTAGVQADLNDMWRDGYRKIRLWLPQYSGNPAYAITNIETIGTMAKAMGFYVIYGGTSSGTTLNDTNWTSLQSAMVARATTAATKNFDEFVIDNEARGRATTGGLTNFFTKYGAAATAVKAVFPSPKKTSYNESENLISDWVGQSLGSIDRIGMNTYGGNNTESGWRFFLLNLGVFYNAFPTTGYISETNLYTSSPYSGLTSRQIFEGARFKMQKIFEIGFTEAYWFSWTSPSDEFAVKKADGTFRRVRYALTNIRRNASESAL